MKYNKTKQAYGEILALVAKYKDLVNYSYGDLDSTSKQHLFGLELKEKYNLNIEPTAVRNLDYCKFKDDISIGWWGEKYNRTMSWEDNNKQPEDELLMSFCYPTGSYYFAVNSYCLEDLFKEFFQELKSYEPKYCDTVNKHLLFTLDNPKAQELFNNYKDITKKYHEKYRVESKKKKIQDLQKELEKLNNN